MAVTLTILGGDSTRGVVRCVSMSRRGFFFGGGGGTKIYKGYILCKATAPSCMERDFTELTSVSISLY